MDPTIIAANFDKTVETVVNYISTTFDTAFTLISNIIAGMLHGIEQVFLMPPYYVVIIVFGLLAWRTAGKATAVFTVAGFLLCQAMNLWNETMVTMALVIAAVTITLVFAIPLGIAAGSNRKVSDVTRVLMDFLQTMPPYVYLIPALAILGFGASPAIAATTIIALRISLQGVLPPGKTANEALHEKIANQVKTMLGAYERPTLCRRIGAIEHVFGIIRYRCRCIEPRNGIGTGNRLTGDGVI